jgi:glucose-1-phosphate cytidylyltransferase
MNTSRPFIGTPVVVLCGGKGVLIGEQHNKRINKALISIDNKPLFYWVMLKYALHGATQFILVVGYQSKLFDNALIKLGGKVVVGVDKSYQLTVAGSLCRISIVETPDDATTGARLLACKLELDALSVPENFAVAYSDTLSDADLGKQLEFHKRHGLIATLLSARLPVRFRILGVRPNEVLVRGFAVRPVIESARVNGGFYLFSSKFWQFSNTLSEDIPLENQPLEELAKKSQLACFEHDGFWQSCDSERDLDQLRTITRKLSNTFNP